MIGQQKLLAMLDSYTIQNLPKALLLVGPSGCGKHTVAKYIAEKFGFDFVEIDNNVSADTLLDYTHKTINTLYLIDLNEFEEKRQNQFLKFIEEPSKTVYVVLISNSDVGILNTIKNRCLRLYFEKYTKEELQAITHESGLTYDIAYEVFQTPGKLCSLTNTTFENLLALADKAVNKLHLATYGNTLLIATKLNFKNNFDKIDPEMFLETVEFLAFDAIKNKKEIPFLFDTFEITNKYKQSINKKAIIKETLILNYLTELWETTHNAT